MLVAVIVVVLMGILIALVKSEENNNKLSEEKNIECEVLNHDDKSNDKEHSEKEKYVFDKVFHVAGISFREKQLKELINLLLEKGKLQKFNGFTNKDIKENYESLSIYEGQFLNGLLFKNYKYNNKDAIKILVEESEKQLEVGNVPKEIVNQLIKYIENDNYIIDAEYEIVGGMTKHVDYDEENDKEVINTVNLNYGIIVYIKIKEK